ncbi:MAG: TonB-dependent siderophore receptor [SAR86 cluster bacterium]|uniref:TonB-dependent siderophore receptor n=1 Tax=SAR86 cluster bacterium TaxID=2030880 RepID=A0A2A5AWZ3_9GAMM|nr:MAG: TonB-dependent siderophore receptor [SAR86 cluster bacterium]
MKSTSVAVFAVTSVIVSTLPQTILAADTEPSYIEEIIIKAIRDDRQSRGATGLDLSNYETPQSLTILDAESLVDFALDDINSVLQMTTGVNVDATETDRTYYNSRGFDITSMHVDSSGIPFGTLIVGDLDTAIYEKVEVIRGSNGLITGLGNPSGTVNYVRKRPSNEFDINTIMTIGRWNDNRIVADVSTPLTESGRWAMRLVGVHQDKNSWLDHYSNKRKVGSIVVDGQLGDTVTLAMGYTYQDNDSDGVLWGAAPIIYTDGTRANFDVSTSTAMNWTYWNTLTETAFVEVGWQIADNWDFTSTLTQTDYEENSELFYAYWNTGLEADTGLGLFGYPGKYDGTQETLIWDAALQGSFKAWGQQHQLNLGLSLADSESGTMDSAALTGFDEMPAFPGWQGNEVLRPTWDEPFAAAQDDMSLNRLYGSLLLSLTERLKIILGMSMVEHENKGVSWGVSTDSDEDGGSPYLGLTWELFDTVNLYASYSDIYQPQYYLNDSLQPLGSAEGKSYEFGLKKQFNNNLLASVAIFRTEQNNLQEFVEYSDGDGVDDTDFSDDFNYSIYRGINVEADGVELEVAGNVSDDLRVQAGYTYLKMEDPNGDEARTFIPRRSFKVLAAWNPSWQAKLGLGLSFRWQDDVHFDSAFGRISQDSYAVMGGYVSYEISDSMSLSLNLDNINNEKYLSSVKYEQSYYAEPRSYSLSINWDY